MKAVVIYESMYGNTHLIANAILIERHSKIIPRVPDCVMFRSQIIDFRGCDIVT